MRAAVKTGWSGFQISFTDALPRPTFNPAAANRADLRLQVKAAGINPVDYKVPRLLFGKVVGFDVSGIVVEVGNDVKGFKQGDEVFGYASQGSLVEMTVAKASCVAHKPPELTWVEAAALPIAYVTGLQGLRFAEGLGTTKHSLLVVGASGGCGLAGMQLAKGLGVSKIVAVCSSKNKEFVQAHGATQVVCYDVPEEMNELLSSSLEEMEGFDCIYDTASYSGAGEEYPSKLKPLVRADSGGMYVQINGSVGQWTRAIFGRQSNDHRLVMVKVNTADLEEVGRLLIKTGARPVIDETRTLDADQVKCGFEKLKSRRTRGKIVFDITAEPERDATATGVETTSPVQKKDN